jgi:hypothetical protein
MQREHLDIWEIFYIYKAAERKPTGCLQITCAIT